MNKPLVSGRARSFNIAPASSGTADSAVESALVQLSRVLWRRKALIAATTIILTVIAGFVLFRLTPLYTAETLMILEVEKTGTVVDLGAVVSGLPADASSIESEIEVLRSRGLATKAVERLGLTLQPEFNAQLRPPGTIEKIGDAFRVAFARLTGLGSAEPEEDIAQEFRLNQVVDNFLAKRRVTSVGRSRAIKISFVSENPEIAARATVALAELYIVERLDGKFQAAREVTNWLSSRVQALRAEVETKEKAVEEFRKKYDLLKGQRGEALLAQEVSELNQQLGTAIASRTEAEAKYTEIQNMLASGQGSSAEAVLSSRLIQDLRREEAKLEAQVSNYATRYGSAHPTMRNAVAQLNDIRQTIDREVRKVAKGLENVLSVARTREAALRAQLDRVKSRVASSNSVEVQLRSLEQEALAARELLETFLQRTNATDAQADLISQQADARIVSYAAVPEAPSFPKIGTSLLLSLIAALVAGIGLALLREVVDNTFRSSEDVEKETGARVLGHIPKIENWRARRRGLADLVVRSPLSLESEAVRRLCTGVMIACKGGASNRIMVTSAQPREGKTSLCSAIARSRASAGGKILLIDCDIRRPTIHKEFGLAAGPGLVQLIKGGCTLEEAIQKDPVTGLDVIVAGNERVHSPQDLLASERMKTLVTREASSYDLVIMDTPPVSAVSDALLLSDIADTIFVIRWGHASKKIVKHALREAIEAGGNLLGVVLSQVDAKEHVSYGYGDAGVYTKGVREYYTGS